MKQKLDELEFIRIQEKIQCEIVTKTVNEEFKKAKKPSEEYFISEMMKVLTKRVSRDE